MRSMILQPGKFDCLSWEADPAKGFSVNSMYRWKEAERGGICKDLLFMRKNVAPPKVQFLGWLALLERAKTGVLLHNMGILPNVNDSLCHFCGDVPESVNHLFLHCGMVWKIWCEIHRWWSIYWVVPASIKSLFCWWRDGSLRRSKEFCGSFRVLLSFGQYGR